MIEDAVVPTPSLRYSWEDDPAGDPAEWVDTEWGSVVGSVTRTAAAVKVGGFGGRLDGTAAPAGVSWTSEQLGTAREVTAFQAATWLRVVSATLPLAATLPLMRVTVGTVGVGVHLMTDGALGVELGPGVWPTVPYTVGTWRYVEVQGVVTATGLDLSARIDGGAWQSVAVIGDGLPVTVGSLSLLGSGAVVVDFDVTWLWAGSGVPGWWSDVPGYTGVMPLVVHSARLQSPFTARLAESIVVHEVGTDTNLDVTVAHADGSVVDRPVPSMSVRPVGVNPTRFDPFVASTWVTTTDVERVARVVLGPSGIVLEAGVHRVWVLYDWSSAAPDWPPVFVLVAQTVLVV